MVRRLLRGLEAAGVEQVYYLPDYGGICAGAFSALTDTSLRGIPVEFPLTHHQEDSTTAAALMAEAGVSCIITLGGDGTNRAVFKGSGPDIPLLPISTGTNNVFPEFQEGTTAGYAAGLLATGKIGFARACWRSKLLKVNREGGMVDLALVDLAVARDNIIGARAIWDVSHLLELFLTRAQPWSIGLSAIGGALVNVPADGPRGLHLVFGPGGRTVRAPVGPGLFAEVSIARKAELEPGVQVPLHFEQTVTLVFDGERDLVARPGDTLSVELSAAGPWVLDTRRALTAFTPGN
jgi:predicted polyphosphate/ATP-dependent NAD kinase